MTKRLYRSSSDRQLTGLCGGIGEYFEVDTSLVHLAWILMTILTGVAPGIVAYVVAAIVIPPNPNN